MHKARIGDGPEGSQVARHAYEIVMETLREEIADRVYPAGTPLPPQVELAERFQVSQITIRRAISELVAQGLLYTGYTQGKRGTIVRNQGRFEHYATDALRSSRPQSGRDTFMESVTRAGRTPSKRFRMKIEMAPPEIASRLGVGHDDLVVHRILWQMIDGEPFSRETSYFPLDLAKEIGADSPHDIAEGTMRRLRDRGIIEVAVIDRVSYIAAGPEDAADLSITIGSPLLVQLRTAASVDRVTRVVQVVRLAERTEIVWEHGEDEGLAVIRATLAEAIEGQQQ